MAIASVTCILLLAKGMSGDNNAPCHGRAHFAGGGMSGGASPSSSMSRFAASTYIIAHVFFIAIHRHASRNHQIRAVISACGRHRRLVIARCHVGGIHIVFASIAARIRGAARRHVFKMIKRRCAGEKSSAFSISPNSSKPGWRGRIHILGARWR